MDKINTGKYRNLLRYDVLFLILFLFNSLKIHAQVPRPSDVYGFQVGADYKAANYQQMLTYYNKLDGASERVKKITIGKSTGGRPMLLLFISSEENLQRLDHWRTISEKLARARIDSTRARQLSRQGRAIVWIDGGMHASEMAHGQMTPLLAYRVATKETPEMQHIRQNVVLLLMPVVNPDGLDMVVSWYREHVGTPYEMSGVPRLWQRYVGHDNNRDYYMGNMIETRNILKVQYRQWYPQIVVNHHQNGSNWQRIFVPPFANPVNKRIHPGVTATINEVGSAMMRRFAMKDMPGVISHEGYTMWWNGGMREVPYFHNMIGILTEASHNSPTPRYFDPAEKPEKIGGKLTDGSNIFYPDPWGGGTVHFRSAINYLLTASIAVLDYAADNRTDLLWGIYSMGRDEIQMGKAGNPYAYIITAEQWDDWEAKNLVNVLLRGGIEIKQATRDFTAGGHHYQAGSYIVYAAQAFRPYVISLLDRQLYPHMHEYPGGPPASPYDLAGWTLPMQMGVSVKRINEPFDASTQAITDFVSVQPSAFNGDAEYGFIIDGRSNIAVKAVNVLFENGAEVSRTTEPHRIDGKEFAAGSYVVRGVDASSIQITPRTPFRSNAAGGAETSSLAKFGLAIEGLSQAPEFQTVSIQRPKVGLYKSWRGNADEGWTYWILQQYHFAVDTLHDAAIRSGNLSQYQSIILPDGSPSFMLHGWSIRQMPKKYTGGLGLKGTLALKKFVQSGGTLIAFNDASEFVIEQFGLPLENVVEGLSNRQFFAPGSLIRTTIDTSDPLAFGMQDTVAAMFAGSRAFEIVYQENEYREGKPVGVEKPPTKPVDVIARYAEEDLLMSGVLMGSRKHIIAGKPAMVQIPFGEGQVVLFAFRPQFRGQSHGTYKLIFNTIIDATMESFSATD